MQRRSTRYLIFALLAFVSFSACGKDKKNPMSPAPAPGITQAPDFSLADVNPNSATFNQAVSPRQHLGHVSAWYFGHAT